MEGYKFYPLKMKPVYKDYLWGGENLHKIYGKEPLFIAESWEASDNKAGKSIIDNGFLKGKTIGEAAEILGAELLGSEEEFSLLFKLIDAHDRLSVQVHPDDGFAFEFENGSKGKTELWYVIHADDGARLIYGFKEDVTKEKFEKAIKNGNVEELLNSVEVSDGDAFFIPAGTIHGIGKGIIIAEIQENSDITYRVYDYDRRDINGNTRELHTDKALKVTDLKSCEGSEKVQGREYWDNTNKIRKIISCEYFEVKVIDVRNEITLETGENSQIIFFVSGSGKIGDEDFKAGDTFLIPAKMGEYKISGNCRIFMTGKGNKRDPRTPQILKSDIKKQGRFTVREDVLKGQKGEYQYSYIKIKSGVVVLPIYNGKIVTIRQYRHAFEDFLYELPAGVIDNGETPEETAIRELYEETGFKDSADYLGSFYPSPGSTDEVIYLYSAKCTERQEQQLEYSEQIDVCLMDENEFSNKIIENKFLHGGALSAYLKYKLVKA